ncbi:MAG: hypothetical protein H6845_01075 [Alphaproteobacteria bacterium]|nr:MAG: hypothetical protein H6845_01075 [Alphaproteobacteria bacterium]
MMLLRLLILSLTLGSAAILADMKGVTHPHLTAEQSYIVYGNKRVSTEQILSFLSILTDPNEDTIATTLSDTGYFSNIQVNKVGVKWNIYVKEFPILKEVKYEVKNSTAMDWEASTGLKKRDFISPQTIKFTEELLKSMYSTLEDTPYVDVTSYSYEQNGLISLKFVIKVTQPNPIQDVIFIGNNRIKHGDLYGQMVRKYKPVLFVFTSKSIDIHSLDQSKMNLEKYAQSLGYLDFKVSSMVVENRNNKQVVVVNVNEGIRYRVGKIALHIPVKYDPSLVLKSGEFFSQNKLDVLNVAIEDLLYAKNYWNKKQYYEIKKRDNVVDIEFFTKDEKPSVLKEIYVLGNKRTYLSVILKRMVLAPGDVITDKALMQSKRNMIQSGFAGDLNIIREKHGNHENLTISFKESDTGSIMLRAGASLGSKLEYNIQLGYKDDNIMGLGKQFETDLFFSRERRSLSVFIKEFFINGKPIHYGYGGSFNILPPSADSSLVRSNWFSFGNYADKSVKSYADGLDMVTKSGILGVTSNSTTDKYDVKLIPSSDTGVSSINEYWSENEEVVLIKTKGFDLRGMSVFNFKNQSVNLTLNPSLSFIELDDNSQFSEKQKGFYKRGVGRTRFFDKSVKKFDRFKGGLNTTLGYSCNFSGVDRSSNLALGADATLGLGTSNYLKFVVRADLTKHTGDSYLLSCNVSYGNVFAIHNYSWFDNFKPGFIRGFREQGPRDTIRFNVLGGKRFVKVGAEFTAPFILPKTFMSKWFVFLDCGALWDSGLSEEKIPQALADNRKWDRSTADIVHNKFSPVISCGLGIKFRLGIVNLGVSVQYPLFGSNSPLNSFETLNIGFVN